MHICMYVHTYLKPTDVRFVVELKAVNVIRLLLTAILTLAFKVD